MSPNLVATLPSVDGPGVEIRPVDQTNWGDFETFFESVGILNSCWCMAWRMTKQELKTNTSACRRTFLAERVQSGVPIGLLAYTDGRPVAWCSVGPRPTHRRLGGDDELDQVWSITCFYVVRQFRGRGLVRRLIERAGEYALSQGAEHLEAYPVDPDSPSYRFMGLVSTFEKAGFRHVKDAGARRHVMVRRCQLDDSGA
ncbi:MAG: GNAT family N-acetyltransferase [Propionibacteriaceae bacterium]|jgi:GNAT superfamily N-acetyltransferase|nr:GNAT family N-acetyltransferase [Propionibacteriaceae bacterium]